MDHAAIPQPTPPPARRFTRLALSAVLLLAGLLLAVAALVITAPEQKTPLRTNDPQDKRPAEASFLNNPPRRPVDPSSAPDPRIAELLASARGPQPTPSGPSALAAAEEPAVPSDSDPTLSSLSRRPGTEPPPPGVYRPYPAYARPASSQLPVPPASWQAAFSSSLTSTSQLETSPQIALPPPPIPSSPPSLPAAALEQSPIKDLLTSRSLVSRAPSAAGPRTLRAGSVLDAILLTAINSDSAGDSVAHLTNDVYGADGSLVLPRGTRLVGSYQNRVSLGQNRLAIGWDRIVLNGRSYDLPGLPTTSPDGAAGLPGKVNNHTALVFGRAALLSLISAGAQLGQPRQSRINASLSDREVVGGSVSQQLSQAATEYLNHAVHVAPTVVIPAGSRVTVLLPFDLQLSPR